MMNLPVELEGLIGRLNHADRTARTSINLVPSENRLSPLASLPLSSDFYNRYFFNDDLKPGFWEFRGGQELGDVEKAITVPALQRLSGARYVNIRSLSGLSAMSLVIAGLAGPKGSAVASVARESGGHFATQALISRMGYQPRTVRVESGRVVDASVREVLADGAVRLVYCDLQNSLSPLDVRSMADAINTYCASAALHVDASHTLGLVLGRALPNPLAAGATSFGGSTHKSFPGPQKGVIFTNSHDVAESLLHAQFDFISSHHFAETIALGIAALEFEYFGQRYAAKVISNAQVLARELKSRGFDICGDEPEFTRTHQLWFKVGNSSQTSRFGQRLFESGVRINVQRDLPGISGDAVRLGTNEVSFEGATEQSMILVAEALAEARDEVGSGPKTWGEIIRGSFGPPYHFVSPVVR